MSLSLLKVLFYVVFDNVHQLWPFNLNLKNCLEVKKKNEIINRSIVYDRGGTGIRESGGDSKRCRNRCKGYMLYPEIYVLTPKTGVRDVLKSEKEREREGASELETQRDGG